MGMDMGMDMRMGEGENDGLSEGVSGSGSMYHCPLLRLDLSGNGLVLRRPPRIFPKGTFLPLKTPPTAGSESA